MALMAGLRAPQRLAGVVGLSGYLPLASTTAAERSQANQGVPIFMAHGQHDSVVVPQRGTESRDALRVLGDAVNKLQRADRALLIITHFPRILEIIQPQFVHVLSGGRILKSAGKELALELEERGYDWVLEEAAAGGAR